MSIIRRSATRSSAGCWKPTAIKWASSPSRTGRIRKAFRFWENRVLDFLVSAGNMDSMVNHYSVSKKRRQTDSYTPGGVMGKRPDYATIVYCNLIRTWSYKQMPIILGGIEASLRRLAHYDYWSGKAETFHSAGFPGRSDFLRNGRALHRGDRRCAGQRNRGIKDITFIDGTVYKAKNLDSVYDDNLLPDYREASGR